MERKHTPGPWRAITSTEACFHRGNRVSIVSTIDEFDQTVAEVWPTLPDGDGDIADGRLIAAAPELLAEMRSALATAQDGLENLESGDEEGVRMALEAVRSGLEAAVAKAIKEEA